MLIFCLVCTFFSLLTIEHYILSGFFAKNHRLLPLALGLITVYNFYLTGECIFGPSQFLIFLKDTLLVQQLSLLLYYILEILDNSMNPKREFMVFIIDTVFTLAIVIETIQGGEYRNLIIFAIIVGIGGFIIAFLFAFVKRTFSLRKKRIFHWLFIAILAPLVGLFLFFTGVLPENVAVATGLLFSNLIINILIHKKALHDPVRIIKNAMFASSSMLTVIFDPDLFFLEASPSAEKIIPNAIAEFKKHPDSYNKKELLKNWTSHISDELQIDFEGKHFSCTMKEIIYNNRVFGYTVSGYDVTSQYMETEEAREEARQKASFMAHMSHEFRSPLHAIISGSRIVIEQNEISERSKGMVKHIYSAGKHLLDLVNAILDYSKLESNKLKLNEQPYNIYNLLEEQANNSIINLRGKDVSFELRVLSECPKSLMGDEQRIREIIQNLLSNAVKFTDKGFITATLKFDREPENNDSGDYRWKVTYIVSDTGSGMTKEQLENVFGEYVSYADNRNTEGTGLGLAIVKQLSEMMGGRAYAESDGTTGTVMTVEFYQKPDGNDVIPSFAINEETSVSTGELFSESLPEFTYPEARILIVDDMEVNRQILKALTDKWMLISDTAENGKKAIEMINENHYDLVFMDQMMPGLSGIDTASAIRKNFSKDTLPLILLTADTTYEIRQLCSEVGMNGYLTKPVNEDKLRSVIDNLLPESKRVSSGNLYVSPKSTPSKFIYESYVEEIDELCSGLNELYNTDLEMFRVKVHGMKGLSRQLGQEKMGYFSEIMEMAAKSNHTIFIEKFLPNYIIDLECVANTVRKEHLS